MSGLRETREVSFSAQCGENTWFLAETVSVEQKRLPLSLSLCGRITEVPGVPGLRRGKTGKCQVPAFPAQLGLLALSAMLEQGHGECNTPGDACAGSIAGKVHRSFQSVCTGT